MWSGAIHRQDAPGAEWVDLDKAESNALLDRLSQLESAMGDRIRRTGAKNLKSAEYGALV
jgi:hypothetical protein